MTSPPTTLTPIATCRARPRPTGQRHRQESDNPAHTTRCSGQPAQPHETPNGTTNPVQQRAMDDHSIASTNRRHPHTPLRRRRQEQPLAGPPRDRDQPAPAMSPGRPHPRRRAAVPHGLHGPALWPATASTWRRTGSAGLGHVEPADAMIPTPAEHLPSAQAAPFGHLLCCLRLPGASIGGPDELDSVVVQHRSSLECLTRFPHFGCVAGCHAALGETRIGGSRRGVRRHTGVERWGRGLRRSDGVERSWCGLRRRAGAGGTRCPGKWPG